jgi:positive regulator of sigma E activity
VHIAFETASACSSCSAGLGCGIGPIVGLFQAPPRCCIGIDQPGAERLLPGDSVRVSIGARRLLEHMALVYLLPLAAMLAGACGATLWSDAGGDLFGISGAALGLALAFVVARAVRARSGLDVDLVPRLATRHE